MAVNFSTLVYLPVQDMFSHQCTFTSVSGNSYNGPGRGIYNTRELNVMLEDGSIISDQDTILDIRASEYSVLPVQNDLVNIQVDPSEGVRGGDYQITDVNDNGGGEVTLQLRKLEP